MSNRTWSPFVNVIKTNQDVALWAIRWRRFNPSLGPLDVKGIILTLFLRKTRISVFMGFKYSLKVEQ
jgi:hypothetical protein